MLSARTAPLTLVVTATAALVLASSSSAGPVPSDFSGAIDEPGSGAHLDFSITGPTITESVLEGFEYTLRGTVRVGETITVTMSGNGTSFSQIEGSPNDDVQGAAVVEFPGADHDERAPLPTGESIALTGTYVVPEPESSVWDPVPLEISAYIGNAFVNPVGGGTRTLMVRGEFEILGASTSDDEPVEPDDPVEEPRPSPSPTPDLECDDPSDALPSSSSVVRFGDLYGEVNVRANWEDDDAYIFAELSTPLRHCDRIRTLPRSGAILSFSDMSTFVMREDSAIVLDLSDERTTKLGHLAGVIWVNFNRMIEDGSMEVEMAQAIAGARGTTFVCEENGDSSTVRVLEGTVVVTPNSGAPVTLTGGQTVTVTADGPGRTRDFDIEAEMARWPEEAQRITFDAIAAEGGPDRPSSAGETPSESAGPLVILATVGLASLATGAVGLVLSRRRPA